MDDRGEKVIFVGYFLNHSLGTYKFIKLSNKKMVLSRDITWLERSNNNNLKKEHHVIEKMKMDHMKLMYKHMLEILKI